MIVELMQCDECKNTHDTRNPIPASWITITQTGQLILHLCSDMCLIHHINSRAHLDLRNMRIPEPQAPQSTMRRFLLVDGETADEFEGVKWSNGAVSVNVGDGRPATLRFNDWEQLKVMNPGSGVTWIDQEVSDE